mmetsp:Transcript_12755/g.39150  ORF Transcript_12755/g.39150 Transcript_12755/m.39150 type:complete len:222 (+) Transcript_12755:698-1363(+)
MDPAGETIAGETSFGDSGRAGEVNSPGEPSGCSGLSTGSRTGDPASSRGDRGGFVLFSADCLLISVLMCKTCCDAFSKRKPSSSKMRKYSSFGWRTPDILISFFCTDSHSKTTLLSVISTLPGTDSSRLAGFSFSYLTVKTRLSLFDFFTVFPMTTLYFVLSFGSSSSYFLPAVIPFAEHLSLTSAQNSLQSRHPIGAMGSQPWSFPGSFTSPILAVWINR